MKKVVVLALLIACIIILLVGCGNKNNDAAYIYDLNDGQQGEVVVTLTWDDLEDMKMIGVLLNEVGSSDITSADTQMKYKIELVNVNIDNDVFEIGFTDGMVCCNGNIQGLTFDHAVSTSITENDLNIIISKN